MEKKTVRLILDSSTIQASGKRRGFYKLVFGVDTSVKNGYAFAGRFLGTDCEEELPVDAIVISKEPRGSVKNYQWLGCAYRVAPGGLKLLFQKDWERNFLSFRDAVAKTLTPQKEESTPEQGVVEAVSTKFQIEKVRATLTQVANYLEQQNSSLLPEVVACLESLETVIAE